MRAVCQYTRARLCMCVCVCVCVCARASVFGEWTPDMLLSKRDSAFILGILVYIYIYQLFSSSLLLLVLTFLLFFFVFFPSYH